MRSKQLCGIISVFVVCMLGCDNDNSLQPETSVSRTEQPGSNSSVVFPGYELILQSETQDPVVFVNIAGDKMTLVTDSRVHQNITNQNFSVQYTRYIKVFLEVPQDDGSNTYELIGLVKGKVLDAESNAEITSTILAGQMYYYECQITVPYHESDVINYTNGYTHFDGEPNDRIMANSLSKKLEY